VIGLPLSNHILSRSWYQEVYIGERSVIEIFLQLYLARKSRLEIENFFCSIWFCVFFFLLIERCFEVANEFNEVLGMFENWKVASPFELESDTFIMNIANHLNMFGLDFYFNPSYFLLFLHWPHHIFYLYIGLIFLLFIHLFHKLFLFFFIPFIKTLIWLN